MKGFIKAFHFYWIATALLFTGCAGIGPGTVTRDRFDYVTLFRNHGSGRCCSTC